MKNDPLYILCVGCKRLLPYRHSWRGACVECHRSDLGYKIAPGQYKRYRTIGDPLRFLTECVICDKVTSVEGVNASGVCNSCVLSRRSVRRD